MRMSSLELTLACGDYDRTLALKTGEIQPAGLSIRYLPMTPGESFWRQLKWEEFDASEMSMSAWIALAARGEDRFVAIPAFTSRAFRHSSIFVRSNAGIKAPADLVGRRVGVPQYHMTAALWVRGMLSDDYGVKATDVDWIQGGLDRPGYPERIDLNLPRNIRIRHESERSLSELLIAEELDAIIGAEPPRLFHEGAKQVRRLFPEPRAKEEEYFQRTGYFPIMHCIAIRRELYERHRWIARSLYDAFVQAKAAAFDRLDFSGVLKIALPWLVLDIERTRAAMGQADYWRYGVETSRHELEAMVRYSVEQGLSKKAVEIERLFAPEVADKPPDQW